MSMGVLEVEGRGGGVEYEVVCLNVVLFVGALAFAKECGFVWERWRCGYG